ncbi:DUF535 domain-containing protein [Paraburkholderia guartelaensis]|uniref:DUF535 domain-containing protein n=1 Tax=Paraburkholderia guartelaensis TaxID=2546446 RepID=A0A4R5LLU7_9BURK|nr:DUF535 family protein [Paraburkholderia guartelaensis]TDG10698.1 DUF535 domain-containing protein [Paraburkholderia guartelaensis]
MASFEPSSTVKFMQALMREAIPGSSFGAHFRRTRIWLYAVAHPRAARHWFAALAGNPLLADLVRRDRRVAELPFHSFGDIRASATVRAAALRDHFALASRLLDTQFLHRLYVEEESYVLAQHDTFCVELRKVTRCRREGLLTVAFRDAADGIDLAWATVTLLERANAHVELFIGGLQGPSGTQRERVRAATRTGNGLRPKAAVIEAVCALGRCLGIARLTAIARHAHISSAKADVFVADYDAFWRELGGIEADGLFELPRAPRHREITEVPSNKRSAFRRRQALIAEMNRQIEHNIARVLSSESGRG